MQQIRLLMATVVLALLAEAQHSILRGAIATPQQQRFYGLPSSQHLDLPHSHIGDHSIFRPYRDGVRSSLGISPRAAAAWVANIGEAETKALKQPKQRVVGELVSKEDLQEASMDTYSLTPGDLAAVLRSDGSWRYARLLRWTYGSVLERKKAKLPSLLKFEVDKLHSTKEFPKRMWAKIKVLKQLAGQASMTADYPDDSTSNDALKTAAQADAVEGRPLLRKYLWPLRMVMTGDGNRRIRDHFFGPARLGIVHVSFAQRFSKLIQLPLAAAIAFFVGIPVAFAVLRSRHRASNSTALPLLMASASPTVALF